MISEHDIEADFQAVVEELERIRRLPSSTYRVQFNRDFTFAQAKAIVPYLDDLGITDLYASPYLKARPDSTHGYDITDHNALNPGIGSVADYEALVSALQKRGMGQVLDMVPNHMGIGEASNEWWMDVLENGPSAAYAPYFDINWRPTKVELTNKVLLPILGDQYGTVLENGELQLSYADGAFYIHYYQNTLPVAPKTYTQILRVRLDSLIERLGGDNPLVQELQSIMTALSHLPEREETAPERVIERERETDITKNRLAALYESAVEIQEAIDETVEDFNGHKGDPHSFDRLDDLLRHQTYRLSSWRVAAEEINYRRFFDINDLAAVRVEIPRVFEETHRLVLRLIEEGKVTGLRIDHPDGLWDPEGYLKLLQQRYFQQMVRRASQILSSRPPATSEQDNGSIDPALISRFQEELERNSSSPTSRALYLVVEKILSGNERLPDSWPVHGTTGYEFGVAVNGLFVDSANRKAFDDIYAGFIGTRVAVRDAIYAAKKLIMTTALSSEIGLLTERISRISEEDRRTRDFTPSNLSNAIIEIIAGFPVYRTYVRHCDEPLPPHDRPAIDMAVLRAKRRTPAADTSVIDFIRTVLLLQFPEGISDDMREQWCNFVKKFQQTTGAVMAKGVEDTTFYRYHRLTSLNDVGGDPDQFGISVSVFHQHNQEYQRRWPYSLLATSTHDAKRSEDVRARINALSEMPREWRTTVRRWARLNRRKKVSLDGQPAPDRNDEYLLYQTLLGAWPLQEMDDAAYNSFCDRINAYMLKGVKEAKVHTSWLNPDSAYDEAVRRFVTAVLDKSEDNPFLEDFRSLQKRVAFYGMFNSLAQTLLKIASPGVPDIYQGNEVWQFDLVDPDNRHPVDFESQATILKAIKRRSGVRARATLVQELLDAPENGGVKLYLTYQALNFRKEHPKLFTVGEYKPLEATGSKQSHVCAFLRQHDEQVAIVAVPRLGVGLTQNSLVAPIGTEVWGGTRLSLPSELAGRCFRNVFTGESVCVSNGEGQHYLQLSEVLGSFPTALLEMVDS